MTNKGSSLVEVIFSVGIIVLVIASVVSLVVKVTKTKTEAFKRNKANEMVEVVVEKLLDQKLNDVISFWELNNISDATLPNFSGFTYSVDFTSVACNAVNCANAEIRIDWDENQSLTTSRFFSR